MRTTARTKYTKRKLTIGFIGQGYVGRSYADYFEDRGFSTVRYAVEAPYHKNRDRIRTCDVVFIATPTPTTPKGFDGSIVREAMRLLGRGTVAVIKSTVLPGTTEAIQRDYPAVYVLHSPEFLTEASAAYDVVHPARNIVGIPKKTATYRKKALLILSLLPKAPYEKIMSATEAELLKYGGNCWFYFKVVFMNLLYDLASVLGARWEVIQEALSADPRIGHTHLNPLHQGGRGAGGRCFIKDFAAFAGYYAVVMKDRRGVAFLRAAQKKNIELLLESGKNLDLLKTVYGPAIAHRHPKSRSRR